MHNDSIGQTGFLGDPADGFWPLGYKLSLADKKPEHIQING
ncbi:hypothetical protein WAA86_01245 [Sediminicola sp. 1XM1-17]